MRTAVLLIVGVAAVVALAWAFQRRLIYLPAGSPPAVEQVLPAGRAVTYTTGDGLTLEGWFVEAGPTAVMVLPGNAGNRAGRVPLARQLADAGLSVLLVDYRGYGGNPGSPTEAGLVADARAAAGWLGDRPGIDDVVYLGESLGAAVAVGLAAEGDSGQGAGGPAAMVLRSPFTSLAAIARVHYGPVPRWLLRDRYPAVEQIGDVGVPVLVVAGEQDRIVPPAQSRRLFDAASEPKRFVTVAGAGHNDRALLAGPRLLEATSGFLSQHGLLGDR